VLLIADSELRVASAASKNITKWMHLLQLLLQLVWSQ
jgi:hypothetical protein